MAAVAAQGRRPTVTPAKTREVAWPECRCPACNALLARLDLKPGSSVELFCRRCGKRYWVEAG